MELESGDPGFETIISVTIPMIPSWRFLDPGLVGGGSFSFTNLCSK